jgi:FKBP-type peptidyl-prolyl cis-trans isomerase FkpA
MRRFFIFLTISLLLVGVSCSKSASRDSNKSTAALETERQKTSYSIGYNIGQSVKANIKNIMDEVDIESLFQGLKDSVAGGKEQIPLAERDKILRAFSQKVQAKFEEKRKSMGEKNKVEGEAFLKENAKRPGVKVTATGLQYIPLEIGKGPTPKLTDKVKVHYKGTLLDGTEFDSSYKRNQPIVFPLQGVIPGWTEGVQLMPVGSRYKFFIPSELAYRDQGAGAAIGPNAVLIFEVQLIEINPKDVQPVPQPQRPTNPQQVQQIQK